MPRSPAALSFFLFEPDYIDPRDLQAALLNRLRKECSERGFLEVLESPEKLRRAMHLILVTHPNLLREAVRICCAENAELIDTAPLPATVCWPAGCPTARLAAYGAFPPDLNSDELAFAQLLDADLSGTVLWWHRNESRKPWSVGLVMPDGTYYYPDFLLKVKGRTRGDGILLVEVKGEHFMSTICRRFSGEGDYTLPTLRHRTDCSIGRFTAKKFRLPGDFAVCPVDQEARFTTIFPSISGIFR